MNQVERLRAKLIEQFPGYNIPITKPVRADGTWMLDVIGPHRFIAIAWRADKGFGVTTPTENDLTTTNDEVYAPIPATLRMGSSLLGLTMGCLIGGAIGVVLICGGTLLVVRSFVSSGFEALQETARQQSIANAEQEKALKAKEANEPDAGAPVADGENLPDKPKD